MSVECSSKSKNTRLTYAKGALEPILQRSTSIMRPDGLVEQLTPSEADAILATEIAVSQEGFRVLAFACGSENNALTIVGLIAIHDPPREECIALIDDLKNTNIRSILITGDSSGTAISISNRIGIDTERTIGGHEIDEMSETQLLEAVLSSSIFYRTKPSHKLEIVKALQNSGSIVAMTGDGGNYD